MATREGGFVSRTHFILGGLRSESTLRNRLCPDTSLGFEGSYAELAAHGTIWRGNRRSGSMPDDDCDHSLGNLPHKMIQACHSRYVLTPLLSCLCALILSSLPVSLFAQPIPPEPVNVTVGAYINDVQALNLREHSYAMDVYLWFRWSDDDLEPAETVEIVNPNELWGHVADAQYEEPIRLPSGELYQVLRVQGRFSHKFLFYNYPYDRQELVVEFEDQTHEVNRLEYKADVDPVAVNPRLLLPGFSMGAAQLSVEAFSYPTAFGDTRRSEPNRYSRVRVSIPISRPASTSSLKMLLPVLCVVFGASLMLRLKSTLVDARIGIGITSLLTVVAIQLASNETMPSVDYLVLMDKIHLTAYVYVLAGLGVVLATVRHIDDGQVERAQRIQRLACWWLNGLFLGVIAILIGIAILRG